MDKDNQDLDNLSHEDDFTELPEDSENFDVMDVLDDIEIPEEEEVENEEEYEEEVEPAKQGMSTTLKVVIVSIVVLTLCGLGGIVWFSMAPQSSRQAEEQRQAAENAPLPSPAKPSDQFQSLNALLENQVQEPAAIQPSETRQQAPVPPIHAAGSTMVAPPPPGDLTGQTMEAPVPPVGIAMPTMVDPPPPGVPAEAVAVPNSGLENSVEQRLVAIETMMMKQAKQYESLLSSQSGIAPALQEKAPDSPSVPTNNHDNDHEKAEIQAARQALLEAQTQIGDLTEQNGRLETEVKTFRERIEELIGKEKGLLAKIDDLLGKNRWLRKLQNDQARLIKKQNKEISSLGERLEVAESRPILPGWQVVGMTNNRVIFRDDANRLLTLKVGQTFAGVQIVSIDLTEGKVNTSGGVIEYKRAS